MLVTVVLLLYKLEDQKLNIFICRFEIEQVSIRDIHNEVDINFVIRLMELVHFFDPHNKGIFPIRQII